MAGAVIIASNNVSTARKPAHSPLITWYTIILTVIACVGGLLFGYDTGIISSAMLYLPDSPGMELDTVWKELVVSITPGAAGLGAVLAGVSSDRFGRRPVLLLSSGVFAIGSAVCAAAPERWTLLCGRVLLGLAIGFASMVIPLYLGESLPCTVRGTLITVYQCMIASGFIVANAVAAGFAHVSPSRVGWRLMFAAAAPPALLQLVGLIMLTDTPRYLVNRGDVKKAREALNKIYGGDSAWVEFEMEEIEAAKREEQAHTHEGFVLARILSTPHVRRAFLVGCSLQMYQQLIGINTILYYTGTIIQSAGVADKISTIWISCAISSVQAFGTIAPMKLIERVGRRPILVFSMAGVIVGLCLMGGAFLLINKTSVSIDPLKSHAGILTGQSLGDCDTFDNCDSCVTSSECGFCVFPGGAESGQCLPNVETDADHSSVGYCSKSPPASSTGYKWQREYCTTKYTAIPIAVMVIYLLLYAFGMGPLPWVFNAEVYPLWARSTAISISTLTNWVFNLIVSLTFLSLSEAVTKYGAFFCYAAISFTGLVVFYFFVPETKGLTVEEVEEVFKREVGTSTRDEEEKAETISLH